MAPTGSNRIAYDIPVGTCFITNGPGKYEFFRDGIQDSCSEPHGLDFKLDVQNALYGVRMRVRAIRQMASWLCPSLPSDLTTRDMEREWPDAWEFTACVPGYGITALGIYDVYTRKGVVHLWQAHVDDYGCMGAKQDLATFFLRQNSCEALLALQRAMGHMVRGSVIGEMHIDCHACWELFRELRLSCDMP